jgi:hypothetical protein
MKALPFFLALLAPAIVWAEPQLGVDQAVKLAQHQLKERGLTGQVYITSVTLQADNLQRSAYHWTVKWSREVELDAEKKESGLEIAMDGSVTRVVRGPANKNPVTGKFDPNGPTGLQNPRTRADRPSILDLKR